MEEKKISVIVPAYNIQNSLGKCLESLIEQSYQNLEIIVVDDGSLDKTPEVLDIYAKKDKRIVAIHQENQGVSSARNRGLEIATGSYIGFVDGDDYVERDMYALLIKLMEENSVDIAHCGYQMIFPDHVDYYYNTGAEYLMNREEGLYALLEGCMVEPSLGSKLYKAELFRSVRLKEEVQETEDLLCNFELFMRAESSYFVDVPKYHYILRAGSATTAVRTEKKCRDRFYVVSKLWEYCKGNDVLCGCAYERYIRIMLENTAQQNYPELQKEFRQRLKQELKSVLSERKIGCKLKMMVYGVVYMPKIYYLVRKIYEKKTGINHKYDI